HRPPPAEDFLHPLAHRLTGEVAEMADGAAVDGAPPPALVLGHVRRDVELPTGGHEVAGIEILVAATREPALPAAVATQHLEGRLPLIVTAGGGHLHVHDQPGAVLHEDAPGQTELGLAAWALPCQPGIGVSGRVVGSRRNAAARGSRPRD